MWDDSEMRFFGDIDSTPEAVERLVCKVTKLHRRLSRQLTSPGPTVCSSTTLVSYRSIGGAAPHAVSATVARECGPQRAIKRGSPIGVASSFLPAG
jgi:hypothetical protein